MLTKEDIDNLNNLKQDIDSNSMFNKSNTDSTLSKDILDGFDYNNSDITTFYIAQFDNLDEAVQELEKMSQNLKHFSEKNSNFSYSKSFKHNASTEGDSDKYEVMFTIYYNKKDDKPETGSKDS